MTKFVNRRLPPAGVTIKGCGENLTLACEIHATLTDSAVPTACVRTRTRHAHSTSHNRFEMNFQCNTIDNGDAFSKSKLVS